MGPSSYPIPRCGFNATIGARGLLKKDHPAIQEGPVRMERGSTRRGQRPPTDAAYFNCVETDEKVVLSLVPRFLVTAIIAKAIAAAIKLYSIAVAADLSRRKSLTKVRISQN